MKNSKAYDAMIVARTSVLLSQPFFGQLVMRLRLVETDGLPTAAVDGVRMYYNPKFILSLTKDELVGVFCHEVLHCALGHLWRLVNKDPTKRNVAFDYVINLIIRQSGLVLPSCALYDEKYTGMSSDEVYNLLTNEDMKKICGSGNGFDIGGILEPVGNGENGSTESDWSDAVIKAAKVAKQTGKVPAGLEDYINKIMSVKTDWKSILQALVMQLVSRDDFTWTRPNSRYAPHGLYLPSLRSEKMPAFRVYVDASGSCWSKQILTEFCSHLSAIVDQCRPEIVYVDYFDTQVNKGDEFMPGDNIFIEPRGGGGTDFRPIFEHVEESGEEPAVVIVLTDGYGPFPEQEPSYHVVWAINSEVEAPWGHHVDIRE